MLQIYFLSIACNLIVGMTLALEAIVKRIPWLSVFSDVLSNRRVKLWNGLSVIIIGFIALFVPAGGVLIIGDLIPSVVGMVMGIALLFEVFRQDSIFPSESAIRQERIPVAYRITLGLLGIAVAVLHFFLPERPFL
jgi:hypothetical protein